MGLWGVLKIKLFKEHGKGLWQSRWEWAGKVSRRQQHEFLGGDDGGQAERQSQI